MEIKTKYNIGDRIWRVYEPTYYNDMTNEHALTGEVAIYDIEIVNIIIYKDEINYICDDGNYTELKEEDIILYEDKEGLLKKIKEIMEVIHKRENGNLQST